jgi:hypothetical membrane protein
MRVRVCCAAVSPAVLGITVVAGGALTPGYSPWRETVSRLGSAGAPHALAVRAGLVLYGLLVVAGAGSVGAIAPARERLLARLVGVYGLAAVAAAVAPKDPPGPVHSVLSRVHVDAAILGGVGLWAAMVGVAAWAPARRDRRLASTAAGLACVTAVAFRLAWGSSSYGLLERVLLVTAAGWVALAAVRSGAVAGEAPGQLDRVHHHVEAVGLEPAAVAVVEVAAVEVVQEHHQGRRADGRAQPYRVEGAEVGGSHQNRQVGAEGGGQRGAVGVVGHG